MKIAILGWGIQGKSAYKYYNAPGNEIHVLDYLEQTDVPDGIPVVFGPEYLYDLDQFDLIVRSPGIHPKLILQNNEKHPEVLNKTTTATNEFFEKCPTPNTIGVTGTKGKGTTSTLITKILEAAGHKVHLGGNIGLSPLDMLKNANGSPKIAADDWVVLELANFQLIDLRYSPKIAVCLMMTEEHLDWHKDMYEYIRAKQNMFEHQNHDDLAIYNVRNNYSEEIAGVSHAHKSLYDVPPIGEETLDDRGVHVLGDDIIAYDTKVCSINDVALLGRHNLENVCAAIAATWRIIGHNTDVIKKVVRDFPGLPHRLEILKKMNNIWYVNDSFASSTEATIAAMNSVKKHKVMIVGGYERGIDLTHFANNVKTRDDIRTIVLIGESKERVAAELKKVGFENFVISRAATMLQIVNEANKHAKAKDAVVMSPGFASFDMFKNFEDRGKQFKEVVSKLQ